MHDVFHMSLLEQDTTRKERMNKQMKELELETGDSEEYEVEAIRNSAVYASKSESGQLPGLYYLLAWKRYPDEENTWEPSYAIQHLNMLVNSFHKNHPEKLTATSPPINSAPPMAKPTVMLTSLKRKQGQPAGDASKRVRNWVFRCSWHLNNSLVILANNKWSWLEKNHLSISHHFESTMEPFFVKLWSIASVFLLNSFY